MAAEEVLKTVALWTRGKYTLAVVPASRRLELRLVQAVLEDPAARLATEAEFLADFLRHRDRVDPGRHRRAVPR